MKRAVLIACSGLPAAPLVARVAETGFIQIEVASLRPLGR